MSMHGLISDLGLFIFGGGRNRSSSRRSSLGLTLIDQSHIADKGRCESESGRIDSLKDLREWPQVKISNSIRSIGNSSSDMAILQSVQDTDGNGPVDQEGHNNIDHHPLDMECEPRPARNLDILKTDKPSDQRRSITRHPQRCDKSLLEVAPDSKTVQDPGEGLLDDDGDGNISGERVGEGPDIDGVLAVLVHCGGETKVDACVEDHGTDGVHDDEVDYVAGGESEDGGLCFCCH